MLSEDRFFFSSSESVLECPRNCHGNGECVSGTCHCFPGFLGPDCSRGMRLRFFFSAKINKLCRNSSHSANSQDRKGGGGLGGRDGIALVLPTSCCRERILGEAWLVIPLSCFISQQPVRCCVAATASTPRAAASVSAAGRAPSATCPRRSVSTRSAGVVGFASWAPVLATLDTKEKTAKKVNMSIPVEVYS